MKFFIVFAFVFAHGLCFSQNAQLINAINRLIAPQYILDVDTLPPFHSYNSFDETDLDGDGKKELIIVASKIVSDEATNKIFILKTANGHLGILDTSAAFEIDGHGPQVSIRGKELDITHGFSHGSCGITYKFDAALKKYQLSSLFYTFVTPSYPDTNHILTVVQTYKVQKKTLSFQTSITNYKNDSVENSKEKEIHKVVHQLQLNLREMRDPEGYDIFIFDGPLYEEMMKY